MKLNLVVNSWKLVQKMDLLCTVKFIGSFTKLKVVLHLYELLLRIRSSRRVLCATTSVWLWG